MIKLALRGLALVLLFLSLGLLIIGAGNAFGIVQSAIHTPTGVVLMVAGTLGWFLAARLRRAAA